jgi:hypothetical protein
MHVWFMHAYAPAALRRPLVQSEHADAGGEEKDERSKELSCVRHDSAGRVHQEEKHAHGAGGACEGGLAGASARGARVVRRRTDSGDQEAMAVIFSYGEIYY